MNFSMFSRDDYVSTEDASDCVGEQSSEATERGLYNLTSTSKDFLDPSSNLARDLVTKAKIFYDLVL